MNYQGSSRFFFYSCSYNIMGYRLTINLVLALKLWYGGFLSIRILSRWCKWWKKRVQNESPFILLGTENNSDSLPMSKTSFLPVERYFNHEVKLDLMPSHCDLHRRRWCGSLLKDFRMWKYMTSLVIRLSQLFCMPWIEGSSSTITCSWSRTVLWRWYYCP